MEQVYLLSKLSLPGHMEPQPELLKRIGYHTEMLDFDLDVVNGVVFLGGRSKCTPPEHKYMKIRKCVNVV